MKKILLLLIIGIFAFSALWADWNPNDPFPFSHALSAEEAELMTTIERDFIETDPPAGPVRPIAEWEPMKAVMIRYPLGIPVELIQEMAEYTPVICIVSNSLQNSAQSTFQNAGVNMDNVSFMNYGTDTYWVRDYGPWFIAYGDEEIGVVNFKYNRPRPVDDEIPMHYADEAGIEWFGMNITHTGGNYMCDGYSQGVNTDLILDENNQSLAEMNEKFADYLGITNMHTTLDPLGDYIKHVDCWGKYLDVDKILISRVPSSNPHYSDYEAVADYFANVTSSYGTPMQVFRVDVPGNNQTTPFSNSLILNGKVFVPVTGTSYDAAALEVYETAMPGYEIIPVEEGPQGWLNTDALHCRTHEIADDEMLYISHMPIINAPVDEPIEITADFIAYSDADLVENELKLFYQINGGDFTEVVMTNVDGNSYSAIIPAQPVSTEVGYYIHGEDQAGKVANHPYIGAPDPHTFTVMGFPNMEISAEEINISLAPGTNDNVTFEISNTGEIDLIYDIQYSCSAANREVIEYPIPDSPAATSYSSNTYTESGWEDFTVSEEGIIEQVQVNYTWDTDNYASEGKFKIESPNGTDAIIASGQADGTYTATLTNFAGEQLNGDWKIWIEDTYGDGGHQATNITVSIITIAPEDSWMTVDPTHNSIAAGDSAEITISANATELDLGNYIGTIIINSNDPDHATANINVNLSVENVSSDDNELELAELFNNYPNPFNPTTTISFSIHDNSSNTEIAIYNSKGQKIKELLNEELSTGKHQVVWNGDDNSGNKVSSGIYFYKIKNGDFSATKKMLLLK